MFHVTSELNRDSIRAYGLDWRRMGSACGIAGSQRPEQEGVFLSFTEHDAEFFVNINNTGGPVDVWSVDGVGRDELVESDTGFWYLPRPIPPEDLALVRASVESGSWERVTDAGSPTSGYRDGLTLTLTLDDGRVLRDSDAHDFLRSAQAGHEAVE